MIKIDLNAAIISSGQNAYMLHPGKNYHLFTTFARNDALSADLPNLVLLDGQAPNRAFEFDAQLNRARALRDWLALSEVDRAKVEVSEDIESYIGKDKRRYHDSYSENLHHLLWSIPEGNVFFVPNPDLSGRGFFCELENATQSRKIFRGQRLAKKYSYVGRPIRNLKWVPMRLIPPEVLEAKSRQTVITEFDKIISEKLYRLYYGSFCVNGDITQMEFDVNTKNFRPTDSNIINALANFFENNLQRLENGETVAVSLLDSVFLSYDEKELQMHARLNSEGVLQIAAKSVSPMVLSAFIALTSVASAQDIVSKVKDRSIRIENSGCPLDDEYPRLIEKRLFGIVDMMGEEDLASICDRIKQLTLNNKITADAKARD